MTSAVRASIAIAVAFGAVASAAGAQAAPPRDRAKTIFQDGERDFQLGKFDAAIEAYERAFNLDPQPAFIFNIALAHRRQYEIDGKLEHLLRARELYRNYLKLDPTTPHRPGVEKLITDLGARIEQARAASAPPLPPVAPAPPPPPSPAAPPATSGAPLAAAAPAALPPAAAPAPTSEAASLVTAPAGGGRPDEKSSSKKTWLIAGGIAAVVVAAAVTIVLVMRSDEPFDGPGIDVTPR